MAEIASRFEKEATKAGTPIPFKTYVINVVYYDDQVMELLRGDFRLISLSLIFVFVYIAFHLRSVFLSLVATVSIIVSFFLTLLLYRWVFGITYFSSLHVLAVFVVLGVAADDVFVYTDAWKQAGEYSYIGADLHRKLAYTQRRASKTIFVTSFTTMAGFLSNSVSDLMPISSFGYFAAIIVPVNYFLVITAYPPMLVVHTR